MTTQEYVKKKAERLTELAIPGIMESETGMIAKQEYKNGVYNGLSAGIELAKAFAEWADMDYTQADNGWVLMWEDEVNRYTTSELFEIFLNERNEK